MTPKIAMPVLRQIYRAPEGPWWRRLLGWWRAPVVYELVEDYIYTARFEGAYVHLFLPRGFRSDLASSPRISWLFGFRPDGLLLAPGLAHDWYYRHGSVECRVAVEYAPGRWSAPVGDGSRAWGDRLFLTIARQVSGLRLPALAAWAALRLFGGPAWRANEKYRRAYAETGQFQLHGDYDD